MTLKDNTYDPGLTCVVPSSNTGLEPDQSDDTNQEWAQYKKRHLQTAQNIVAWIKSHA